MSTSQNFSTTEQVVRSADFWEYKNGSYIALLTDPNDFLGEHILHTLLPADFKTIHPQLPGVMSHLLHVNHTGSSTAFVKGTDVLATLLLLQNEHISVIDSGGTLRDVIGIHHFEEYSVNPDFMDIEGRYLESNEEIIDGECVKIVTCNARYDGLVSKVELDSRYPGWGPRWRIGVDLDLSIGALVQYTLKSDAPQPVIPALPDCSFE